MNSPTSIYLPEDAQDSLSPQNGPASEPSVSARSIPTPAHCSSVDGPTSQTSETPEPQTGGRIQGQLFSPEAFRASRRAKRGNDSARAMTVGSGRRLLRLLRLSFPDGSSLRTFLDSCISAEVWNSSLCSLKWKASVTPFGRLLFRLVPRTHVTSENDSGLWPTPRASDGEKGGPNQSMHGKPGLCQQATLYPTPVVSTGHYNTNHNGSRRLSLHGMAQQGMLPTPLARDARSFKGAQRGQNSEGGDPLTVRVGGSLNPDWVEWLMGYPRGWTDLSVSRASAALGIRSSLKSPRRSSSGSWKSKK